LGVRPSKWSSFQRIRIGREVFHSRTYLRCVARNSYTVNFRKYGEILVGQVEFYLQIQSHDGQIDPNIPLNVAIVSPMENEKLDSCQIAIDPLTSASAPHIHTLKPVEQYKVLVVPVESILHKCVYIVLPDKKGLVYACSLVNSCEQE